MLRSSSININSDNENLLLWGNRDFIDSLPETIDHWTLPEVFRSTAVTIDLETRLLEKTIEDFRSSASVINLQLMEIQKIKKLTDRINALEEVSGLLSDLSSENKKSFEDSIKRRALFK